MGFPVAQTVKNLPAMWETRVPSPGGGNGYPAQHSCLGNLMDRRALAAVHGVTERQAWLRASWGPLGRALTPGLVVWDAECRGAWRHWSSGLGMMCFPPRLAGSTLTTVWSLASISGGSTVASRLLGSSVTPPGPVARGQGRQTQRLPSAGCADTAAGASCRRVRRLAVCQQAPEVCPAGRGPGPLRARGRGGRAAGAQRSAHWASPRGRSNCSPGRARLGRTGGQLGSASGQGRGAARSGPTDCCGDPGYGRALSWPRGLPLTGQTAVPTGDRHLCRGAQVRSGGPAHVCSVAAQLVFTRLQRWLRLQRSGSGGSWPGRAWEGSRGLARSTGIPVGLNWMISAGAPTLTVDFCRGTDCRVFLPRRSGWTVNPHHTAAPGSPCVSFLFLTASIYLRFASVGGMKPDWDLGAVP